jgi:hypothetical protein
VAPFPSLSHLERGAGNFLYHYTTLSTAIESVLPTRQFRMSPFSRMRDPRESEWLPSASRVGRYTRDEKVEWREAQRLVSGLRDTFKVMSLTRDVPTIPDPMFGRGFARPRLWEQYAGNHVGVCLCFVKETLHRTMTAALSAHKHFAHGPVTYHDAPIRDEAQNVDLQAVLNSGGSSAFIQQFVDRHLDELFFKKLTDWETEHEFRFVVWTDDTAPLMVDVGESLRAVVMGSRVAPEYHPSLKAVCDPHQIRLFGLWWNRGRPELIPLERTSP